MSPAAVMANFLLRNGWSKLYQHYVRQMKGSKQKLWIIIEDQGIIFDCSTNRPSQEIRVSYSDPLIWELIDKYTEETEPAEEIIMTNPCAEILLGLPSEKQTTKIERMI